MTTGSGVPIGYTPRAILLFWEHLLPYDTEEVTVASTACPHCSDARCCMARPVCLRLKRDVVDQAVEEGRIELDFAVERLKRPSRSTIDPVYMEALVSAVTKRAGLLRQALCAQAKLADR